MKSCCALEDAESLKNRCLLERLARFGRRRILYCFAPRFAFSCRVSFFPSRSFGSRTLCVGLPMLQKTKSIANWCNKHVPPQHQILDSLDYLGTLRGRIAFTSIKTLSRSSRQARTWSCPRQIYIWDLVLPD